MIGSTGSGKSTLVNLIPRFYDVSGGAVLVDGVDVKNVTQHDLRDKIGYVAQKAVSSPAPSKAISKTATKMPPEKIVAAKYAENCSGD